MRSHQPTKSKSSSLSDFIFWATLGVCALIFVSSINYMIDPEWASRSRKPARDGALPAYACEMAQDAVRSRLKAPATAEFPSCGFGGISKYEIKSNAGQTAFSVAGYVDAQNGFGAKLRNRFIVILLRSGEGHHARSWTVDTVSIAP